MIQCRIKIPETLKVKLSVKANETKIEEFVNQTTEDALGYVHRYGVGSAGGNEPEGGAPVWQGRVGSRKRFGKGTIENQHYRGYLRDSHYINKLGSYHMQIVSSADFVNGVLEGYSTNWSGVTFGANNYHKRAVDDLIRDNVINTNWRRTTVGV